MAHDLIIRGGTVVDGTGAPRTEADVAVDGDRITAVGALDDAVAREEIDATGMIVSPGFIDLHTHLDAQVAWDPLLTSSSWHGVTTVLMGNCGFSFAPVSTGAAPRLAELMESIEDIPRQTILRKLPWDWTTYRGYLDSVRAMEPALNMVGLVGHAAIRFRAMGERALDEHGEVTDADLSFMRELAAEATAGGAVGVSTSRLLAHVIPDGRTMPGTYASQEEVLALVQGALDGGGHLFQVVPDYDTRPAEELELVQAVGALGADVLAAVGPGNDADGSTYVADLFRGLFDQWRDQSTQTVGYSMTRPSGTLVGLAQVAPVDGPRWDDLMALPSLRERLDRLRRPSDRAALIEEGTRLGTRYDPDHIFAMGTGPTPDHHMADERSVLVESRERGVSPIEWIIDRLLASDGQELFNSWFFHRNRVGLARLLEHPSVYPGAGDTGAHAGQICDADAPTHFLTHWIRDVGLLSLEESIHRLTERPARLLRLEERGVLRPGSFADLNVFDLGRLATGHPEYVHDFPAGQGRLRVGSDGYARTLVNGVVVAREGESTGARPGRVLTR